MKALWWHNQDHHDGDSSIMYCLSYFYPSSISSQNQMTVANSNLRETLQSLQIKYVILGKSSIFSWWEFCCSNYTAAWCRRIPQSYPPVPRKPWVVGTKMPRARNLPGHWRPALLKGGSQRIFHMWEKKRQTKLLMLFAFTYPVFNAICQKHDLMLLDFMSFIE